MEMEFITMKYSMEENFYKNLQSEINFLQNYFWSAIWILDFIPI